MYREEIQNTEEKTIDATEALDLEHKNEQVEEYTNYLEEESHR